MIKRSSLRDCSFTWLQSSHRCKIFILRTSRNVSSYNLLNIQCLNFTLDATVFSLFTWLLVITTCYKFPSSCFCSTQKLFKYSKAFCKLKFRKLWNQKAICWSNRHTRASLPHVYYKFKKCLFKRTTTTCSTFIESKAIQIPSGTLQIEIFPTFYVKSNDA